MFPENWHFNSRFVLKTTKTPGFVFITEILWRNKWRSVFDVVKDYSLWTIPAKFKQSLLTVIRNSIFHKLYPRRSMIYPASSVASNILLASVIHPAPPSLTSPQSVQQPPQQPPQQPQPVNNEFRMRPSLTSHNLTHYASTSILQRSATFSAMQTDL